PAVGRRDRLHLVWVEAGAAPGLGGFQLVPNPIRAAYSDDGGRTFSAPVTVSDPDRALVVAPAGSLGRHRAIHVAYSDLGDARPDYQGLDGPAWDGPWSIIVATSLDGGKTYARQAVAATGIAPPGRVMLIFTMAAPAIAADRSGHLWVAWTDARNG